jgi:pilus assembly protein CpaE
MYADMRVTDLLRTLDLFEHLSPDELEQLATRMHEQHARAAEVVCRQGEPSEAMFIVLEGRLQLSATAPDGNVRVTRQVSSGDFVGEIALFSGEPHPATAATVTDCRLLVLPRDEFEVFVANRPHVMRNVLAAVSRRAARANQSLMTEQSTERAAVANGRVYPVFSPRGGAGKTTLAINLALRLAELMPGRVGMVDLDLLFDDAALLLDLTPVTSLAAIAESDLEHLDPRALSSYLVEHPSGLRVLVGATHPEEGERVSVAHVRAALGVMKRQFLVTIVDCGNNFAEPTLAALEMCDRLVVLCTPELSTLRDVRDCQRIFGQALHLDKTRLSYVYNHPLPARGLTRSQFETALEQDIALEIPHAGDAAAKTAVASETVLRPAGRSAFGDAIDTLARDLRPPEVRSSDARRASGAVGTPRAASATSRLLRLLRGNAH